jgi:uncharacterized protein with PIN domain
VIVVDTSALIVMFEDEEDAACHAEAVADVAPLLASAATVVETGIVMLNRNGAKVEGFSRTEIRSGALRADSSSLS